MTYVKHVSLVLLSALAATYAFWNPHSLDNPPKKHEQTQVLGGHEFDDLSTQDFVRLFLESEETRARMIQYASDKLEDPSFEREEIFLRVCDRRVELMLNPFDLRGKKWITLLGSLNKTLWLTDKKRQLPYTLKAIKPKPEVYGFKSNPKGDMIAIVLEQEGKELTTLSHLPRYLSSSVVKTNQHTYIESSKETVEFVKVVCDDFFKAIGSMDQAVDTYQDMITTTFKGKKRACGDCELPYIHISEIAYGDEVRLLIVQYGSGDQRNELGAGRMKVYKWDEGFKFVWSKEGWMNPYMDIDGDGFPEFTFGEYLDGYGLTKIYPEEKEITRNCPGA